MQDNKEILGRKFSVSEFISELWGGREAANARVIGAACGVALGLLGYFLGRCELLFSTFPLGIALLCAANRKVLFVLCGLIASAISLEDGASAVYIGTYAVTAAVRVLAYMLSDVMRGDESESFSKTGEGYARRLRAFWSRLFSESVWLRMCASAVAVFCLSLYAIISGGFRYYDLFGAFFALAVAPTATFIYSGFFEKELKRTRLYDVGALALLASAVYSVRDLTFFGICIGALLAFFATLCIGKRRSMLSACAAGLALGLAFDPIYAPLFILEGAAAGVLWSISPIAAATAGCIVGMIWGVYVNGMAALSELLPALLCGTMIFGAADKLSLITANPEIIRGRPDERESLEALIKDQKLRESEEGMRRLSDMFSELAEAFFSLSDRLRRPAALDLRRMCDGVYDRYCPDCPKRELCWGVEYSDTLDILNRLTADLHTKAKVDAGAVPEYMRSRCPALPQMINEINESCARLTEQALLCDRTGVFAVDYDGISKILSEAVRELSENYVVDDEKSLQVCELLRKLRFGFDGVIVYGGRRLTVLIKGLDGARAKIAVSAIRAELEGALKIPLGDPVLKPFGGRFDLSVSAKRNFSARQYSVSLPAEEDGSKGVCGDTVSDFTGHGDYYYALISDGMGSGREAALTSNVCAMFTEKMLTAGNRAESAVKLLNSFMSERDGRSKSECSATLDLLELDLISGSLAMIKSGAAPTYIKRGGNCFKLGAKTVPLGIIENPDAQRLRFCAEAGDLVIMVSDGVTQSREDCVWLVSMLTEDFSDDPAEMAKTIAERARAEGSLDDITVSIVKIGSGD